MFAALLNIVRASFGLAAAHVRLAWWKAKADKAPAYRLDWSETQHRPELTVTDPGGELFIPSKPGRGEAFGYDLVPRRCSCGPERGHRVYPTRWLGSDGAA